MMSVFCSKTLIFAPKCWKCILTGPDFKLFAATRTFAAGLAHATGVHERNTVHKYLGTNIQRLALF